MEFTSEEMRRMEKQWRHEEAKEILLGLGVYATFGAVGAAAGYKVGSAYGHPVIGAVAGFAGGLFLCHWTHAAELVVYGDMKGPPCP